MTEITRLETQPPAPFESFDRTLHAQLARMTGGLSPAALGSAYLDWAVHLAASPAKQWELAQKATRKLSRFAQFLARCAAGESDAACIEPLPQDKRFAHPAWRAWPYNALHQAFLLNQQWWHNATTGLRGVSPQHEQMVEFGSRQFLDMLSPSNFLPTNPQLQQYTLHHAGLNLARGWMNLLDDAVRTATHAKPAGAECFRPGRDVAVTPGQVIYRNRLIELIQYAPAGGAVHPEPVLVVPAWIMKYYILDLSPQNSLVKYLVEQGHTVFMISWKNPGPEDRDLGFDDYRKLGVMAALDAIGSVLPGQRVHLAGYCLGGTLAAFAAAAMAGAKNDRLKSLTLIAAQTDFHEAGEVMLFINESQIAFLEDLMWQQGYLDSSQMAGAFQMLRPNDLIWSRMIHDYLMGERRPMNDLMAWNADGTRMPYRMHSDYLRRIFLHNDLAEGRLTADGHAVALSNIRVPIFAIGTTHDHVAPWRSVYKVNLLSDADVNFALVSGGHNAGVVAPPSQPQASYRTIARAHDDPYVDPDIFFASADEHKGSWWPYWRAWIAAHSGAAAAPPRIGSAKCPPLCAAPGAYVLQA
ncbi:MAG: PHA/PHB synthase family protein [Pseudorhodoplanes sp.]